MSFLFIITSITLLAFLFILWQAYTFIRIHNDD